MMNNRKQVEEVQPAPNERQSRPQIRASRPWNAPRTLLWELVFSPGAEKRPFVSSKRMIRHAIYRQAT